MERMRIELQASGQTVHFIAINKADAVDQQTKLVNRCAFPLFQDIPELNVWERHNGRKDDFYVYDQEGKLADYLSISGERSVNLGTEEGYNNLKTAILNVLDAR